MATLVPLPTAAAACSTRWLWVWLAFTATVPDPRVSAIGPVRTCSRMPKPRSIASKPSTCSSGPVAYSISVDGLASTTRAP